MVGAKEKRSFRSVFTGVLAESVRYIQAAKPLAARD
jgi:hypothetical protein